MRESEAAVLTEWVAAGGVAVVTFFSAIVDEDDRVYTGGYTGPLRDMLGVRIEEFAPVEPERMLALDDGTTATLWSERLRPTTAAVEASFVDGPGAGSPAITRNAWGAGVAWYVATMPSPERWGTLVADAARVAGVRPPARVSGGDGLVEVVRRTREGASYLFAINHSDTEATVDVVGEELVTGMPVTGQMTVPAGAVRIVREEVDA
jgi:beta-galactosidase